MRIAIQQPYFYPYPRYFALISQVDIFVMLTDVQYIRRGWVNRNRIPSVTNSNNDWSYIRVPVEYAPQHSVINEIKVSNTQNWKNILVNNLQIRYGDKGLDAALNCGLQSILNTQSDHLLTYLINTIQATMSTLKLNDTIIIDSATMPSSLTGAARILEICKDLSATEYWNLPRGKTLYSQAEFLKKGINLHFIDDQLKGDADIMPWSVLHAICSDKQDLLQLA